MRIDYDTKLDFDDVLIRPKRSTLLSRKNVDLVREYTFRHSAVIYKAVPVIAANMDHVGTFEMAAALAPYGVSVALHKHYPDAELFNKFVSYSFSNKLYVPTFYSMGISDADFEKFNKYCEAAQSIPKYINIDIANGYSEQFARFVTMMRGRVGKDSVIMAGNVVTGEMTEQLLLSGADIVKVGIGPGSVCTTRRMTGVGYPQLSATIECADAAHGLGGHICADGGCKVPGDVAKAFAAGADFVMLGGMLSGHQECSGDVISRTFTTNEYYLYPNESAGDVDRTLVPVTEEKDFMKFYGMSSDTAMNKYSGGVAGYRAPEGKTVEVPFKGPVAGTIQDILGGLRSACTYVGAQRLKDLSKCTTFVLVNRQLNTSLGE